MGSCDILSFSTIHHLSSAVLSINLGNIEIKILGNAENQIRGCWVRSKRATSVLCSPPSLVKLRSKNSPAHFVTIYSFEDVLRDGIVLCNLINKISPGSVKKIATKGTNFQLMENIQRFVLLVLFLIIPCI